MRVFKIPGLLIIAFGIMSCILDPYVKQEQNGVCYEGGVEFYNLVDQNKIRLNILTDWRDTLFIDTSLSELQVEYSWSIDSSLFDYGSYYLSVFFSRITSPELIDSSREVINNDSIHYNDIILTEPDDVEVTPESSQETSQAIITYSLASLNSLNANGVIRPEYPPVDTIAFKVYFSIKRVKNNIICSQANNLKSIGPIIGIVNRSYEEIF